MNAAINTPQLQQQIEELFRRHVRDYASEVSALVEKEVEDGISRKTTLTQRQVYSRYGKFRKVRETMGRVAQRNGNGIITVNDYDLRENHFRFYGTELKPKTSLSTN